jgi:cytochrome c oxidase cbb3-type subunit 4
MDYPLMSSIMTVVMMTVFIGIVLWAWSGKRRADFEAAARVPLEDDEEPAPQGRRKAAIEGES